MSPRVAVFPRAAGTLALLAVACGAWQGLCWLHVVGTQIVPAPLTAGRDIRNVVSQSASRAEIWLSLRDIAVAAFLAGLGGVAIGMAIHAYPRLRRGLEPYLASYYAVPMFVFYPVLITLLGSGRPPIIAISVMLGIVSMITTTLLALDGLSRSMARTARVFRLSPLQNLVYIRLPAVAPVLLSGLRLCISYAFIGVIASEFIMSDAGIGYQIAYSYDNFDSDDMYGFIGCVVILSAAMTLGFDMLLARFGPGGKD